MKHEEILKLFEDAGAIQRGHFQLSSGRHSDMYIQCALVLQHPRAAEELGTALAAQLGTALAAQVGSALTAQAGRALASEAGGVKAGCVVAPALGGLIIGHEVARALGVRFPFVERDSGGQMALRRGFSIAPGERVVVIEDVWTTGGSTRETAEIVEREGGKVVAVGALIDRTAGKLEWKIPAKALLSMEVGSWLAEECPLCRAGVPATKPGSRIAKSNG